MSQKFETTRRVQFSEIDLAGFVHFTNYLHYMEETEYAFLRSLELNVVMTDEKGMLGFPRLNSNCRYIRPARLDDELTIMLTVAANNGKSLKYSFRIARADDDIATGELEAACCRFPMESEPFAIPIPDRVLDKIPLC